MLASLLNRHIFYVLRTNILGARTNKAVIRILFQHMSSPSSYTATRKNGRIQINRNAHHVVDRSRIKVDVRIQTLMFSNIFLNDMRNFIPATITGTFTQLFRHLSQVSSTRILSFIHSMSKPHNAFFALYRSLNICLGAIDFTNLQEHTHDLLICTSMEWTRESPNSRS